MLSPSVDNSNNIHSVGGATDFFADSIIDRSGTVDFFYVACQVLAMPKARMLLKKMQYGHRNIIDSYHHIFRICARKINLAYIFSCNDAIVSAPDSSRSFT